MAVKQRAFAISFILIVLVTIPVFVWIVVSQSNVDVYKFDTVVDGLHQPVGIAHAGDNRLFIIERNGVIRIVDTGEILQEPFLDIRDKVNIEGNIEQGLLSLAFDPNYSENRFFYVTYTDTDFTVHLERYQTTDNPNIADASSAERLLSVEQTTAAHNGGHIRFGSDGYFYVSFGDGGESVKITSTGQNKDDLLGKILRLDVSRDLPYAIPEDNPFVDDADARPEIWVLGLRNPWQFSFAPETNDMFITDVGWSSYEEINLLSGQSQGGENFGWRFYEGNSEAEQPEDANIQLLPKDTLEFPIYAYPHITPDEYDGSFPVGCAIIGGFVYRGEALSQLQGQYLYGDFCNGQLWTLTQNNSKWDTELLVTTNQRISAFGEDVDGEIYMTTFLGEVRKLIVADNDELAPDGDMDYDLVENAVDNCREIGNPDQEDNWGDVGVGDACDQNFYTNGSSVREIKIFQQHYGAFHMYGCEGLNCGFLANLEVVDLSKDDILRIESENFTGWIVEARYVSTNGINDIYGVTVTDADGKVHIDNLQIVMSPKTLSWRTIS